VVPPFGPALVPQAALHITQPFIGISLFSNLNSNMFCNLNGKIINESNATVSINNRSFRYGDGCFETMKIVSGKLLLANYHFERLFDSLQLLKFDCPNFFTADYLSQQIQQLILKNQHQKIARVRLMVFRGNGGLYDPENMAPNWLIQSWPLNEASNSLNNNGIVTGIYNGGVKAADAFSNLKSNNYLLYSQAALYAKQQHWNDALILNHRGTIADATIANLFLISGNSIITPPLADGPVNGIMRRFLISQLPKIGFDIFEQTIQQSDIENASEAFLTNAIYGIKWIQCIGEKTFSMQHSYSIHKQILEPMFV
jgi:branched-subunit amino acid aminotransferase/4-amino-4-deoxychorismate lyase